MIRGNGQPRRVVITGMGVVSPLGSDVETLWKRLIAGESGIGPVTRFDTTKYDTRFAAEVQGFRAEDCMDRKEIRRTDLFVQYAIGATAQAVKQAGVSPESVDPNRYGVVVGSGIGGIATFEDQHRTLLEKGPSRVSPFFIPMMISDMASGQVSIQFGAKGPNYCTVSACSSGAHAVGDAFRIIQYNEADVMISDMASGQVSIQFGAKGPNYCTVSACSSGAHAVGEAFRIIQYNEADVMISAGAEAP